MNERRGYKLLLLAVALGLIVAVGFLQSFLNRERAVLGLTRLPPLENAPPVLALTTQALGGFRGLIANALWLRAGKLQEEDKFFEMVQLADWITKLEPHFVQVWLVQAWNMAFNISVKFSDAADRWRWVQRGIELLRDEGLRFNPQEALIYRELAWFFQFKMGQNLDDAHFYYKTRWAELMMMLFGSGRPDFAALIDPKTPEDKWRSETARESYKLDPRKMQEVDARYGPLDWRLPETHAIYWASLGLEKSRPDQLITLRRVIYQSMQIAFQRGDVMIVTNAPLRFGPNLGIVEKANNAYEEMIRDDVEMRLPIQRAHRNFLREATYQLYIHNRITEAQRWMAHVRTTYPDAIPPNVTLPEYAILRVTDDATGQNAQRIVSLMQAMVTQHYLNLAAGEEDQAMAYLERASEVYSAFVARGGNSQRTAIQSVDEIRKAVLSDLLDPERGLRPEPANILRSRLGLPAPTPPVSTNASPAKPTP